MDSPTVLISHFWVKTEAGRDGSGRLLKRGFGFPTRSLSSRNVFVMSDRKQEVVDAVAALDKDLADVQVHFETTHGPIRLELWPDVAPGHCENIAGLAAIGFYNDINVHRIIPDFVIQAGCPQGTGTGGPGYTIDAEFNDRLHEKGVLSMARTSAPNSAGSQFFICLGRVPHLDNQYTAFGKCVDDESLETIDKMAAVETDSGDGPLEPVVIISAKVV